MSTTEEMIKQMYGSNLNSQKEQLKTDYEGALSDLNRQKIANQESTDANLRKTDVEAQRAQVNNEEYYAASGLSSGAKAQARLAQGNQLQANMTAIRAAQQEADAEVERQRGLLAQEYASAIQKAQADNDLALAQALYEEAKDQENKLIAQEETAWRRKMEEDQLAWQRSQAEQQKQQNAAQLRAQSGDFSGYAKLYGLSDKEVRALEDAYAAQNAPKYVTPSESQETELREMFEDCGSAYDVEAVLEYAANRNYDPGTVDAIYSWYASQGYFDF